MKITVNNKEVLIDKLPKWWNDFYWSTSRGYVTACTKSKPYKVTKLHRMLLGLKKGDGKIVDHINRNPLDNRLSNLRIVDATVSCINRGYKSGDKRGVCFNKITNLYRVRFKKYNSVFYGGYFKNLDDAVKKATQMREELFEGLLTK